MNNPSEPPQAELSVKPKGALLLSLLFYVLSAIIALGATVEFATRLLTKLGYFRNSILNMPISVVIKFFVTGLGLAFLPLLTGYLFSHGRFLAAAFLSFLTFAAFAYLLYFH